LNYQRKAAQTLGSSGFMLHLFSPFSTRSLQGVQMHQGTEVQSLSVEYSNVLMNYFIKIHEDREFCKFMQHMRIHTCT